MLQAIQGGGATVAATGSTVADAALLPAGGNKVTGADGNTGVVLPPANPGDVILVHNTEASALKVYPPTGGKINGGAANAELSHTASKSGLYQCVISGTASEWFALLGK